MQIPTNKVAELEYELFQKVEQLYYKRERSDVGTPDYENIDLQLQIANDDLNKFRREMCEDHMTSTYSEDGYDHCKKCGSK